jgi:catechol 2,3-dioxygenase-like lactoylglutathione lyase family enzyme
VQAMRCTRVYGDWVELPNALPDFFRDQPHVLSASMIMQEEDGIIVELVQMHTPVPRSIRKDIRFGDIGVNKLTTAVADVEEFYAGNRNRLSFVSAPKSATIPQLGEYGFVFARDPEGNLLEFASSSGVKNERMCSLGVGVTDLERSLGFYQRYLGYDTVVSGPHDGFSGLVDEISGSRGTQVLSCALANSNGGNMLELYEVSRPRGRSVPLNAMWGDFGMLELAHACDDIHTLTEHFLSEGIESIHRPRSTRIKGEATGTYWYVYFRDPDGIPVEVIMEEWERE